MHLTPTVLLFLAFVSPQAPFNPREQLDAGRYLKVLADSETELKRNPANPLAWAAKSQSLAALLRFREAEEASEKALSLNPKLADALLARGVAKAGLAIQQRNLGSLRKAAAAMDDFRAATERDPTFIAAWNSLGLAYQEMPGLLGGSTREALRCADRLQQVSPARGNLLRGMVLALDDRWLEGEPFLKKAVELSPTDPQVIYGFLDALGRPKTREFMGRDAWKQRCAFEARRLWPGVQSSSRGLQAVCDALLAAEEGEEAWKLALGALPATDSPSLARMQLGKIAARAGLHREEGIAILDKVLAEPLEGGSGGYASAHWRRGQILKDLGRIAEAQAAARAALIIDSKHAGARKLLSELKER